MSGWSSRTRRGEGSRAEKLSDSTQGGSAGWARAHLVDRGDTEMSRAAKNTEVRPASENEASVVDESSQK